MKKDTFKKAYEGLNKEQKEAVDAIDGPVMVIAGPGTGKTTLLTLRIANILRLTDTSAESILALTFTESGVASMKKKLFEIIGESAYRVKVSTFHSFANEIIQNYPQFFPKIIGSKPSGEIGQVKIIKEILEKNDFKEIKTVNSPFHYLNSLKSAINHLKKEGYTPTDFKKWIKKQNYLVEEKDESKYERSLELAELFELYEKSLIKNGLYDYEDMLLETSLALSKHKGLLRDLQENYLYILADEHQDANGNQNKILEKLASYDDNPNLFIVGDEKQAIYRFQGASLENFLYFKNKFPKSKVITLVKNYRSTQEILDASHHLSLLLNKTEEIKREKLISSNLKKGELISIISFENEDEELDFVIQEAMSLAKTKKVAILYRNNDDVLEVGRRLRKRNADFVIKSDEDVMGDNDIKNFLNLLRVVNDPTDDENLSKVLFLDFLDMPLLSCLKLIKNSKYSSNIIESLSLDLNSVGINKIDNDKLNQLGKKINEWTKKAKNESLLEFLDLLFEESGFKSKLLNSNKPIEKIEKFRSFYAIARSSAESKNGSRLFDFIKDIELLEKFDLKTSDLVNENDTSNIILMTAHKSKGLEFDVVFIIKANEERWVGKTKREYFILPLQKDDTRESRNMDERRLFYVALTRAKEKLIITYSDKDYKGKILSKSTFIDNIDEKLLKIEKGEKVTPSLVLKTDNPTSKKDEFKNYVSKILFEEGINVTALNNYLNCPWKYFFQNLIRIPHAQEKHQQFGTAIHYALRKLADDFNLNKKPTFNSALKYFDDEISRMDFSVKELKDWKERGKEALTSFFKGHVWTKDTKSEFKMSSIPFSGDKGVISLKGNIDQLINKSNGNFVVLDFKTGNTKTRNEILGNTKNSNGDIFRQLLFYKLMLETYFKDKKVEEGVIEFVEPDDKGRFKKESFDLKFQELDGLKNDINKMIKELLDLEFIDKKCEERGCEFCEMGEILKEKI